MAFTILGAFTGAAGIFSLYRSWSERLHKSRWRTLGWVLVALSLVFWSMGRGAEFGITLALCALALAAWLITAFNADLRHQQPPVKPAGRLALPTASALGKHLWLFVVAVPLAGTASILASAALTCLLPWQAVNEMVFAVLLMPLLWGSASYWACADEKPARPALGLSVCAGLSAIALFM